MDEEYGDCRNCIHLEPKKTLKTDESYANCKRLEISLLCVQKDCEWCQEK